MATKRAPLPDVRPFGSVGTVRMTSGSASASNWTMTGPGKRRRGASWSESVPGIGARSQSNAPVPPSTFHAHIAPLEASMVVTTTSTFEPSMRTAVGSDGCVPRSKATSHNGALGELPSSGRAKSVGSSVVSSTTARTKSVTPSRSTSSSKGCVTARCPDCEEGR